MEKRKEISDIGIIVGLILLQLAVTLPFINSHPIGLDEPFSIFYAQQDLTEFIPFLSQGNNPPLHFVLLHYWIELFGISASSVRGLSLLFSIITIPILFRFGKRIVGQNYAILLVGFFVFSTFNHFHALEARPYSLMVLLTLLIMDCVYNLVFTEKKVIIQLAFWNVLLLYTHYLGGLIIGVEVILLLIFLRLLTKKSIIQFVLSGVITTLLYLPSLIQFYQRLSDFSENGTWVSKPHITELYGNIIRFFNHTISFVILTFLLLLFVIINKKHVFSQLGAKMFSKKELFVFYAFGIPYLLMFAFSIMFQPIFLDRYLLFTTPFLFLSFVILIKFVLGKITNKLYIALFILPMIFSCYYIPQTNRDGDEIASFVMENKTKGTKIVICPPFYDLTFIYHYDINLFQDYHEFEIKQAKKKIESIYSFNDINITINTKTLFFVDANLVFLFPNNDILKRLNEKYTLIEKKVFKGGYTVYQYSIND